MQFSPGKSRMRSFSRSILDRFDPKIQVLRTFQTLHFQSLVTTWFVWENLCSEKSRRRWPSEISQEKCIWQSKIEQNHSSISFQDKKVLKVLHLTDPHYDPDYVVGSNAVCQAPLCCNADSGECIWHAERVGRKKRELWHFKPNVHEKANYVSIIIALYSLYCGREMIIRNDTFPKKKWSNNNM